MKHLDFRGCSRSSPFLEHLTKSFDGSEADDSAGEHEKGAVEVGVALVSDSETRERVDPGECALDHPSVLAEMLGAVDAATRDAGRDAPLAQVFAATVEIVALT